MAEVYDSVNGLKLEKAMALTREAQAAIEDVAKFRGMKAEGLLNSAPRVRTGDSKITVDMGEVDRYVILDDEAGLQHAMTIEYGREAGEYVNELDQVIQIGAMEGLAILHRAFPEVGTMPRRGIPGEDIE